MEEGESLGAERRAAALSIVPFYLLYDEAKAKGWSVISVQHGWNRVFPFDK